MNEQSINAGVAPVLRRPARASRIELRATLLNRVAVLALGCALGYIVASIGDHAPALLNAAAPYIAPYMIESRMTDPDAIEVGAAQSDSAIAHAATVTQARNDAESPRDYYYFPDGYVNQATEPAESRPTF